MFGDDTKVEKSEGPCKCYPIEGGDAQSGYDRGGKGLRGLRGGDQKFVLLYMANRLATNEKHLFDRA